jgi:hypothetical protein
MDRTKGLMMADFEQECSSSAGFERHAAPFRVLHLVPNRGIGHALRMPFFVQAYLDDHALTATAATAKDAFAKAIEWHVVGRLIDISISDGTRNYSITEFSVMALAEIANTVEAYVNENLAAEEIIADGHHSLSKTS